MANILRGKSDKSTSSLPADLRDDQAALRVNNHNSGQFPVRSQMRDDSSVPEPVGQPDSIYPEDRLKHEKSAETTPACVAEAEAFWKKAGKSETADFQFAAEPDTNMSSRTAQGASTAENFRETDRIQDDNQISATPNTIFLQQGDIKFVGRGLDLFLIYVVNFLLMTVTLGIYSFWAKTRLREYLWSKTTFLREPFEYMGTGWELFRSFLIVASMFFIITFGLSLISLVNDSIYLITSLVWYFCIILIWPYAIFSAIRFRLTRSCWRGIHGHLAGRPINFALRAWLRYLLVLVTAGLYLPHATAYLTRYVVNSTSFGSLKFNFDNKTSSLSRPFYRCWLLGGVGLLLIGVTIGWTIDQGTSIMLKNAPLLLLPGILGPIFLTIPWIIYQAVKINWQINGIRLGEASLESEITIPGYAWLTISNWILTVCTLGFGIPWVRIRRYKFLARHVRPLGQLDWGIISQAPATSFKNGEGLLNVLDLDLGF